MRTLLTALALAGFLATATGVAAGPGRRQSSPDAPPAPRVVAGPLCGGEDASDCETFPIRLRAIATAALDLHARADESAPVVGRVMPGEAAEIVARETTYLPHRGVVRTGGEGLSPGDVVYLFYGPDVPRAGDPPRPAATDAETEQNLVALLRRGRKLWVRLDADGAPVIDWEGEPTDTARHYVHWVRLQPANAPGGWLRAPETSFCWVGSDC